MQEIEVIVIDNGGNDHASSISAKYASRLNISHHVNETNLGPGGSLNKGLGLATGSLIAISNDDVILPHDLLARADLIFATDNIGCVGFRAIENGYVDDGGPIGIVENSGCVRGNFNRPLDELIEVEHVYGFFYIISRQALTKAGFFDKVLLARPYASGNRIETDHSLSILKSGLRVVYDGTTGIIHQAKPRTDIVERSLKWRLNEVRNTGYLFLKHFGITGKRCLSLRYILLSNLGLLSFMKRPNKANCQYFLVGLRGRMSAIAHWLKYLVSQKSPS
jgi:GT2 family glycosyltransferase